VLRLLPILLAIPAFAQTVEVQNTGKIGRRVENRFFAANLPDESGTMSALTFKEFGVTFSRNSANGRMHKGPSIQRAGAPSYKDQGNWSPVQEFREDRKTGVYIHHREGYFPAYPEVRVVSEYRFPPDTPYFFVSTSLAVEKPIRVSMIRNNEMTMDLFFTHLVWPGGGTRNVVAFDARYPIIEKAPIPADVPWLVFVNLEKGYGYGFVNLGYKATKTARPDTTIADGYPSGSTVQPRPINARYWSRHLIFGEEVDLVPGDRFDELTAYVLFHCSEKSPLGDFPDLEKRIRASVTAR